jgi:hypothetical protein
MILESTGNRPNFNFSNKTPWEVEASARLWLFLLAAWAWLNLNTPKAQVYTLTRYDLARKRFVLWPVAVTFLSSVTFYLCLHWLCNLNSLLVLISQGLEETAWLA